MSPEERAANISLIETLVKDSLKTPEGRKHVKRVISQYLPAGISEAIEAAIDNESMTFEEFMRKASDGVLDHSNDGSITPEERDKSIGTIGKLKDKFGGDNGHRKTKETP